MENRIIPPLGHGNMAVLEDSLSGPPPIPRAIPTFFVRHGILERKNRHPRRMGRLYRRISGTVLLSYVDGRNYSGALVHRTATPDMEISQKTRNTGNVLPVEFPTGNSRMALYVRRKRHVVVCGGVADGIGCQLFLYLPAHQMETCDVRAGMFSAPSLDGGSNTSHLYGLDYHQRTAHLLQKEKIPQESESW